MSDQIVGVFSLGDAVTWTSQSGGYRKTKTGEIAQVVQPGEYPDRDRFPVLFSSSGVGAPRKETSYVVLVGGTAYWPRTNGLAPVDVPQIIGHWKRGPVPEDVRNPDLGLLTFREYCGTFAIERFFNGEWRGSRECAHTEDPDWYAEVELPKEDG